MYNFEIQDHIVTFLFKGSAKESAILRKDLQTNIYNYAIGKVIFYENGSSFTEESLVLRFGLLYIEQPKDNFKGCLDVKGPKMVTTEDITGIKSIYKMPILYLRENEYLKCEFILEKNCGKYHQKYNPVASIGFVKHEDGFKFKFELTGVLTWDQIYEQLKMIGYK